MSKFYSLDNILKIDDAQYYIIFGERSNGKSYAVNKRNIDRFFKYGEEFVICKRYEEDMKTKTCSTMLSNLEDYVLNEYDHKIKYYQGKWYVYPSNTVGKMNECVIMGHALSINASDRIKGAQFPNVTTIVLEEFMSMNSIYLPNELNLFINLVSTIARNRTNVKIFMLGNAISKYSVYSEALEVRFHRMKKGEILVKEYHNKKGFRSKIAIERTENVDVFDTDKNTNKIVYNMFGEHGASTMITTGDFETGVYNKHVNNITFHENLKSIPRGKYTIVGKEHRTPFMIKYEDYYYRMYLIEGDNITLAFRECNKPNGKEKIYMINNRSYIENVVNIRNITTYRTRNEKLDEMIDEIIHSFMQDNTLFLNNDNGEDVYSAMRLSGLTNI